MTALFLITKNAKETKIRCRQRYIKHKHPIRCFLYIARPFSSFLLISLLISFALCTKIERLFPNETAGVITIVKCYFYN